MPHPLCRSDAPRVGSRGRGSSAGSNPTDHNPGTDEPSAGKATRLVAADPSAPPSRAPDRWIALVLLDPDLAWATFSTARHLSAARVDLEAGVSALERGDVGPAQASFEEARVAASAAGRFGRHPSVALLRLLPVGGDHVAAIGALADAAELTATSGEELVQAAGSHRLDRLRPPRRRRRRRRGSPSDRRGDPAPRSGDPAPVRRPEAVGRHRRLRARRLPTLAGRLRALDARRPSERREDGRRYRPRAAEHARRPWAATIPPGPSEPLRPTGYRRVPGVRRRAPSQRRPDPPVRAESDGGRPEAPTRPSSRRGGAPLRTVRGAGVPPRRQLLPGLPDDLPHPDGDGPADRSREGRRRGRCRHRLDVGHPPGDRPRDERGLANADHGLQRRGRAQPRHLHDPRCSAVERGSATDRAGRMARAALQGTRPPGVRERHVGVRRGAAPPGLRDRSARRVGPGSTRCIGTRHAWRQPPVRRLAGFRQQPRRLLREEVGLRRRDARRRRIR